MFCKSPDLRNNCTTSRASSDPVNPVKFCIFLSFFLFKSCNFAKLSCKSCVYQNLPNISCTLVKCTRSHIVFSKILRDDTLGPLLYALI